MYKTVGVKLNLCFQEQSDRIETKTVLETNHDNIKIIAELKS